jgi:hypothetical protein
MDAHFNEYLAAAAAIREMYGESPEDHGTEFHDDAAVTAEAVAAAGAV